MCSSSPLQTELDCFLLLKAQETHYLESLALILQNGPTGREHVLFLPPYFWRQTWTDLFWFTKRVMFLPQTQASFMSFQSSVYLCGHSFPQEHWNPSVGHCVQSHGCALWQELLGFEGGWGWGGEVFSTSRIFLVCLPPSSNQETGWLFKKIVNRAEHPVFGHKIHRRYKKSRVLKHKPTTFFFELYSPFLHN